MQAATQSCFGEKASSNSLIIIIKKLPQRSRCLANSGSLQPYQKKDPSIGILQGHYSDPELIFIMF